MPLLRNVRGILICCSPRERRRKGSRGDICSQDSYTRIANRIRSTSKLNCKVAKSSSACKILAPRKRKSCRKLKKKPSRLIHPYNLENKRPQRCPTPPPRPPAYCRRPSKRRRSKTCKRKCSPRRRCTPSKSPCKKRSRSNCCSKVNCCCPKKDPCCPRKDSCCPKKDPCCPKKDPCCPQKDCCCPKKDPCCSQKDCCCPKKDPCCPLKDCCCPKEVPCCPQKDSCCPKKDPCCPKTDSCCPRKDPCCPQKVPCRQRKESCSSRSRERQRSSCSEQANPCREQTSSCKVQTSCCKIRAKRSCSPKEKKQDCFDFSPTQDFGCDKMDACQPNKDFCCDGMDVFQPRKDFCNPSRNNEFAEISTKRGRRRVRDLEKQMRPRRQKVIICPCPDPCSVNSANLMPILCECECPIKPSDGKTFNKPPPPPRPPHLPCRPSGDPPASVSYESTPKNHDSRKCDSKGKESCVKPKSSQKQLKQLDFTAEREFDHNLESCPKPEIGLPSEASLKPEHCPKYQLSPKPESYLKPKLCERSIVPNDTKQEKTGPRPNSEVLKLSNISNFIPNVSPRAQLKVDIQIPGMRPEGGAQSELEAPDDGAKQVVKFQLCPDCHNLLPPSPCLDRFPKSVLVSRKPKSSAYGLDMKVRKRKQKPGSRKFFEFCNCVSNAADPRNSHSFTQTKCISLPQSQRLSKSPSPIRNQQSSFQERFEKAIRQYSEGSVNGCISKSSTRFGSSSTSALSLKNPRPLGAFKVGKTSVSVPHMGSSQPHFQLHTKASPLGQKKQQLCCQAQNCPPVTASNQEGVYSKCLLRTEPIVYCACNSGSSFLNKRVSQGNQGSCRPTEIAQKDGEGDKQHDVPTSRRSLFGSFSGSPSKEIAKLKEENRITLPIQPCLGLEANSNEIHSKKSKPACFSYMVQCLMPMCTFPDNEANKSTDLPSKPSLRSRGKECETVRSTQIKDSKAHRLNALNISLPKHSNVKISIQVLPVKAFSNSNLVRSVEKNSKENASGKSNDCTHELKTSSQACNHSIKAESNCKKSNYFTSSGNERIPHLHGENEAIFHEKPVLLSVRPRKSCSSCNLNETSSSVNLKLEKNLGSLINDLKEKSDKENCSNQVRTPCSKRSGSDSPIKRDALKRSDKLLTNVAAKSKIISKSKDVPPPIPPPPVFQKTTKNKETGTSPEKKQHSTTKTKKSTESQWFKSKKNVRNSNQILAVSEDHNSLANSVGMKKAGKTSSEPAKLHGTSDVVCQTTFSYFQIQGDRSEDFLRCNQSCAICCKSTCDKKCSTNFNHIEDLYSRHADRQVAWQIKRQAEQQAKKEHAQLAPRKNRGCGQEYVGEEIDIFCCNHSQCTPSLTNMLPLTKSERHRNNKRRAESTLSAPEELRIREKGGSEILNEDELSCELNPIRSNTSSPCVSAPESAECFFKQKFNRCIGALKTLAHPLGTQQG
ncbi:uncharacterized protein [Bemisia tabaci]|uniref:uncharacterized protein isoform X4 n=1 Tax=Bemisia tabaci TaxID=7038 RepID=UPI003B27D703